MNCNFFSHRCKVCRNWVHFVSIKTIQVANSFVVIFHYLFYSFQCINSWYLHKNLIPSLEKGELKYRKVKSRAWLARGRSRIRIQAVCLPSPHFICSQPHELCCFCSPASKSCVSGIKRNHCSQPPQKGPRLNLKIVSNIYILTEGCWWEGFIGLLFYRCQNYVSLLLSSFGSLP